MAENIVVVSKIKDAAKAEGLNTAQSVGTKLDELVRNIIKDGCDRAKANGRKTLMEQDL